MDENAFRTGGVRPLSLGVVAAIGLAIALAISVFYYGLEATLAARCAQTPDAACAEAVENLEFAATAK